MDIDIVPVTSRLWRSWRFTHITLGIAELPKYTIYTWVESGKCRLTSCQRTVVPRRDLNPVPGDLQSGDLSTRPQHLYGILIFFIIHLDTDRDFDVSAEMMVHDYDDEQTLEEEEQNESGESFSNNELDELAQVSSLLVTWFFFSKALDNLWLDIKKSLTCCCLQSFVEDVPVLVFGSF